MEVILTEDVPNLGNMGDVVTVKPGYGRNFLIPKGLAVLATRTQRAEFEHVLRQIEQKREKLRASAEDIAKTVDGIAMTIAKQAGDEGKLFGSVTNRDIQAQLAAQGHEIDRRRILINEPIKELGIYEVGVKLHADVTATIKVWVAAL